MLPHEIEPFANHHREKLLNISEQLTALVHPFNADPVPTTDQMKEWIWDINQAAEALVRFRVCMADEVRQKENYRLTARDHRLHCPK